MAPPEMVVAVVHSRHNSECNTRPSGVRCTLPSTLRISSTSDEDIGELFFLAEKKTWGFQMVLAAFGRIVRPACFSHAKYFRSLCSNQIPSDVRTCPTGHAGDFRGNRLAHRKKCVDKLSLLAAEWFYNKPHESEPHLSVTSVASPPPTRVLLKKRCNLRRICTQLHIKAYPPALFECEYKHLARFFLLCLRRPSFIEAQHTYS